MELEFQQIDLRNEHLRKRNPGLERQLLASLDGVGQRVPVIVVAAPAVSLVGCVQVTEAEPAPRAIPASR